MIERLTKPALTAALAALAAPAAAQQPVPQPVRERVDQIVAACVAAGGRLGAMTGERRFVVPVELTGDGRLDFLVSEGNVPCTGRPELFRQGGEALVEVYDADGRRLFADRLLAYRLVAGQPARLQVARAGADRCGGDARCGSELVWNAGAARLDERGTSGRLAGQTRPAPGAAPQAAAAAFPAAAALPAAAAAPGVPLRHAAFAQRCTAEQRRRYPQMNAANLGQACAEEWKRVEAAVPVARLMLAAVPQGAGELPQRAELARRLSGVQWGRPVAARPPHQQAHLAGRWQGLDVSLAGEARAEKLSVAWQEMMGEPPYDVAGAMETLGADVQPLGCYHFGKAEAYHAFRVTPAGGRPLLLRQNTRHAAMGGQMAWQQFTLDLSGRLPTAAELRAEGGERPWENPCSVG